MPLLMLKTTVPVPAGKRKDLILAASRMLAETTGKPEAYVMVTLEQCAGSFDGRECAMAFADVRGIGGLSKAVNAGVSKALCDLLQAQLGIPPDKVYSTFTDVPASSWGWKGSVFG
jgi:phenylpyruvate tautomerase